MENCLDNYCPEAERNIIMFGRVPLIEAKDPDYFIDMWYFDAPDSKASEILTWSGGQEILLRKE